MHWVLMILLTNAWFNVGMALEYLKYLKYLLISRILIFRSLTHNYRFSCWALFFPFEIHVYLLYPKVIYKFFCKKSVFQLKNWSATPWSFSVMVFEYFSLFFFVLHVLELLLLIPLMCPLFRARTLLNINSSKVLNIWLLNYYVNHQAKNLKTNMTVYLHFMSSSSSGCFLK